MLIGTDREYGELSLQLGMKPSVSRPVKLTAADYAGPTYPPPRTSPRPVKRTDALIGRYLTRDMGSRLR
jgi:hypothetical protein